MNKLKAWRIERGLSQLELAEASGVPRYAIQLAEQTVRDLSLDHQGAIAKALGVPSTKLFPKVAASDQGVQG